MKEEAKKVFLQAIDKNKPAHLIDKKVSIDSNGFAIEGDHFSLNNQAVYLIASGKASVAMAGALKKKLPTDNDKTICIARKDENKRKQEQSIIYASHPYPDRKSVNAADTLIDFIERIPEGATVVFALSGGTSALVSKPAEGISIDEIAEVNKLLLHSGAAIGEINCVRKHLSDVKGGQLLNYFQPDITLIDLVISDVPGDNLEHIGSGLTVPDSTTFQEAYHILLEFDLWEKMPKSARKHIEKGLTGEASETLKPREDPIQKHTSVIIGSAKNFAKSMGEVAEEMGFQTKVAKKYYNTSVSNVMSEVIKDISGEVDKPTAFIYYGESTVSITGSGKGGRNQEMAMRAAVEIGGMKNITWLSAGTDGIDGPTDAAGAIVTGYTLQKAKEKGLDIDKFIKENDSYHFHEKMNTHLITGPTGNNLMDVVLVLLDDKSTKSLKEN